MPQQDWFDTNRFREYPFSVGPTLDDQGADRSVGSFRGRSDSSFGPMVNFPFRNAFIVDAGFFIQPRSSFDPHINSIHLVQMRYDQAVQKLYLEFRSDAESMECYRFVVAHDMSNVAFGTEPKFTTHYVTAVTGPCFRPSMKSEEYFPPAKSDLAPEGMYEPEGVSSPYVGWAFVTVGELADWFAFDPLGSFTANPQVPFLIEPACVQTMERTQVLSLNLVNEDAPTLPDPCVGGDLIPAGADVVSARGIIGHAQMKEGMNAIILVNQAANSIELSAAVGAGEGGVCEDPYADDEDAGYGFQYGYYGSEPRLRRTCRGLIYTIAGQKPDAAGVYYLLGGPGVEIVNLPAQHTIVIRLSGVQSRFLCLPTGDG